MRALVALIRQWRSAPIGNSRWRLHAMQLVERVAIVTGASRGIGRAIALELGKRGATIIVNYNASIDAAQEVVRTIEAAGGRAVAVKADVSNTAEADGLIQAAVEPFGQLDILV